MKKILPPARFKFVIDEEQYVLVKNKLETEPERTEIINKVTYFYLSSAKYFAIKSHIIAINNQFERLDIISEKLTLLSVGLTRRLKGKK